MNDNVVFELKGDNQYTLVKDGDLLDFPYQKNTKPGDELEISTILRYGAKKQFGHPYIEGMKPKYTIIKHLKGKKISYFKYKAKRKNGKMIGHRSLYTRVKCNIINE